ncbi:MAG: tail fiber domain-containing protein [Patescibacteria group bacterium]|nr:tail fiber domain-containing protein [Patescibacteria group bacterium]MDE1944564.1 tail fiber domain-containing protein [Patescibacteria group bacterium]MDE1945073.1 tail fiber domain-containing protein [Patescibacteria group bacterium]MDE2057837.1 tail fiber domain-containing protein [Patescibacteria group bacterium]
MGTKLTILGSGNVGIGTTSPTQKLQIGDSGSCCSQANYFSLWGAWANSNAPVAGIMFNNVNANSGGNAMDQIAEIVANRDAGNNGGGLSFITANTSGATSTALYINSSGNVGIGTTTPVSTLAVESSSGVTGISTTGYTGPTLDRAWLQDPFDSGSNFTRLVVSGNLYWDKSSSLWNYGASGSNGFGAMLAYGNSGLRFYTKGSSGSTGGTISDATLQSTYARMVIDQNGNVGIGTTSPAANLQVDGTNSSPSLTYHSSGTQLSLDSAGSTELVVGYQNSGSFPYWLQVRNWASGADPFAINPLGGNVGIGTTTPGATLTVAGAGCFAKTSGGIGCSGATTAGDLYYGSAHAAGGYDVAEQYPTADPTLAPGEIVAVDPAAPTAVERASGAMAPLGIVSTAPGLTFGTFATSSAKVAIALSGRVPVKVTMENGPIKAGDRIALSATTPGEGAKAVASGRTVGVALESRSTPGEVTVFVEPEYTFAPNQLAVGADGSLGAATSTPQVAPDTIAEGFVDASSRAVVTNVAYRSDASSTLAELRALQPATYTYTADASNEPRLGLLAEDVRAVAPELLSADGSGVDLFKLSTLTLAGVQALAGQVDTLSGQVAAQGSRLSAVEASVAALQGINLDLAAIASSTLDIASTTTPLDAAQAFAQGFFGSVFGRMAAWMGSASNGINDFFAKNIYGDTVYAKAVQTNQLCLSDANGTSCYTRAELDAALHSAGETPTASTTITTTTAITTTVATTSATTSDATTSTSGAGSASAPTDASTTPASSSASAASTTPVSDTTASSTPSSSTSGSVASSNTTPADTTTAPAPTSSTDTTTAPAPTSAPADTTTTSAVTTDTSASTPSGSSTGSTATTP